MNRNDNLIIEFTIESLIVDFFFIIFVLIILGLVLRNELHLILIHLNLKSYKAKSINEYLIVLRLAKLLYEWRLVHIIHLISIVHYCKLLFIINIFCTFFNYAI